MWMAVSVRSDSGPDTQDTFPKEEAAILVQVYKVHRIDGMRVYHANICDELHGHGKAGFLPVYMSGRNAGRRNTAPSDTSGTEDDDRKIIQPESIDIGYYASGMYNSVQVFL